ncbi:MAG: cyclic dehypoxanthinyl futalosine synthase [Candidatus Loosdrechtia sp.]|uniref:radical SAM protein n=1 Tax=Candidatus Loosdrechtia sp. TaxID=3101272 RepID=UPI003A74EA95|nr:MAG: cyclic dehypoxanthinyl futalosine synthase [Candidatus Jettenia sp. AMX2]
MMPDLPCSPHEIERILEKSLDNKRLSPQECSQLFSIQDLSLLGMVADEICKRKHPENYRTYIIDRNINYTNTCISGCTFCAFYKDAGHNDGYVITPKSLFQKIEETLALGGRQILLQGGLHPSLKLDFYINLLKSVKTNYPVHIHAFSPPEIIHFSKINTIPAKDILQKLQEAGLDSMPGGGAEILVDRCRNLLSPQKCAASEWLNVMREAHKLGMKTTATMMFGHIETLEERVEHLENIRRLQDETGGFTAFIAWTFQPKNTRLNLATLRKHAEIGLIGSYDYLRTIAISRLYLDNFSNIQASWVTQGSKIAQLSLKFGANDMGSTMIEENVVRAAGVTYQMDKKEIESLITDMGYYALQRNFYYEVTGLPVFHSS